MIGVEFIFPRIQRSSNNCTIFGKRIRPARKPAISRRPIIGCITPMCRCLMPKNMALAKPAGNWDVVHTIPYCIGVLRGEIAEDNPRKITKTIAVILLAHCVGDIHQPLHVGAECFNETGEPIDPDRGATGLGDEGGNSLSLVHNATAERTRHYYHSFHAYWDWTRCAI